MAKVNEVQKKKKKKKKRAQTIELERVLHEHPFARKLKTKPQPLFGKCKYKLLKKWHQDQKEAMEKGILDDARC